MVARLICTKIFPGCAPDFCLMYKYDTQLFSSCHPEKNLGRFYKVPFKSLFRVQIKRPYVSGENKNTQRGHSEMVLPHCKWELGPSIAMMYICVLNACTAIYIYIYVIKYYIRLLALRTAYGQFLYVSVKIC